MIKLWSAKKIFYLFVLSTFMLLVLPVQQIEAAIFRDSTLRYRVSETRLVIEVVYDGEVMGRYTRSGERQNGQIITFTVDEDSLTNDGVREMSVNGQGMKYPEIEVSKSDLGKGISSLNTTMDQEIADTGYSTAWQQCTGKMFENNQQFTKCITDSGGEVDAPPENNNETEEEPPTCENKGGPFGWIMCWVVDTTMDVLDTYADWISSRLEVDLNENGGRDDFKKAWESIRGIANIVFVMAFLFIIISQALTGKF